MRRYFFPRAYVLIQAALGTLYAVSLAVWAVLVLDTARIVQEGIRIPPTATALPTTEPSPSAPTPLPTLEPGRSLGANANISEGATRPLDADPQAIGYHPKTGRYISAWLPTSWSDSAEARASFEASKDILDEVSPFWYGVNGNGSLAVDGGGRDRDLVEVAHANNVLVIPTVHNVVDVDTAAGILADPDMRRRHINFIVEEVLTYNYDGIDIDYEMLAPSMRESYSAFIIELSQALHAQGKLLTVAAHAKTSDYGGLGAYQDWVVLNQYVDRVRIMTYDLSWSGGRPGPIAPVYWVEAVATYARTVLSPEKIVIGVPFYGYNWPPEGRATAMTWTDIQKLIQTYEGAVNLLESDSRGLVEENWFVYNAPGVGRREVWYATAASLEAKLDLVQRQDLAGIAIWRLGNEDPKNWDIVRKRLVQDPFELERQITPYLPEH